MPDQAEAEPVALCDLAVEVHRRRYDEAVHAGLTGLEAELFADSTVDIGQLRHLVALGCPPGLIARIVI
jgi:hypothetical protein